MAVTSRTEALTALAAVPPAEFTATRDELVAELRLAGDRVGAAALKKLRRPAPALWAVNEVARRHPELAEEVVAASDAVRVASSKDDRAALRLALRRRRSSISNAVARAEQVLVEIGASAAQGDRLVPLVDSLSAGSGTREWLDGVLMTEPQRVDPAALLGAATAAGPSAVERHIGSKSKEAELAVDAALRAVATAQVEHESGGEAGIGRACGARR